jgi:hypothetical protein
MNDTHLYTPLIALTQENRRLINLAGAGVCLACEAISPAALIETYASDTAVCPQCGKDAMVPAWTTRLLDAVSHEVYGSPIDATNPLEQRQQEDIVLAAIHGEVFPLLTRIEQRAGQKLMPALWSALTRALASLGASEEQLKQGVEIQVRSQQSQDNHHKKH